MRQTFNLLMLGVVAAAVVSCSKNNGTDNPNPTPSGSDTLSGAITADRTLSANKVYYISGPVFVKNNATLKIEAGTVIKAIKNNNNKAVLVITRGSKLNAEGTAAKPIVFTSNQAPGQRNPGDWGGVVLAGKAKVNTAYNGVPNQRLLEGFDVTDIAKYGGDLIGGGGTTPDDADNSGVLKYVRIEFSGIALSAQPNSELNGLSFIAVGSGTVVENVQVSFSGDDSFEWWGGTVNAKNLIAFRGLDDDFDTDNGYRGNVQFGLSVRDKDLSDWALSGGASNGFESDNEDPVPATLSQPITAPTFSNMTFLGPTAITGAVLPNNNAFKRAAHLRRGTQLSVFNSVFASFPDAGIFIDGALSQGFFDNGDMQIKNNIVAAFPTGKYLTTNPATWDIIGKLVNATFKNDASITTVADLKLANLASLTTVDARPVAGSPLLNKAEFTSAKISGTFFKKVTYAGAFDVNDTWAQGWTNWDPNNTNY
ncbi:hypothetical protein KTO58_26730 [Chitinophaga pendula]|uniref:hypothetical protein n=1 Tax=Chitinophaga TaxID=79328 RepID=UPI000BAFE6EB|nr:MULTISPECIES: hypothetical protein [Chitinophaga]ASZ09842.1 hypothetical protein CK934_02035 [Chitinophaga sp. MD30]UCJ07217.1 hypothetical protein KTO58_26730 [Chitinophaga pendula]